MSHEDRTDRIEDKFLDEATEIKVYLAGVPPSRVERWGRFQVAFIDYWGRRVVMDLDHVRRAAEVLGFTLTPDPSRA